MSGVNCTRCQQTGFINTHQLPEVIEAYDHEAVEKWINENDNHDVAPCDCCDGSGEHHEPIFDCM